MPLRRSGGSQGPECHGEAEGVGGGGHEEGGDDDGHDGVHGDKGVRASLAALALVCGVECAVAVRDHVNQEMREEPNEEGGDGVAEHGADKDTKGGGW